MRFLSILIILFTCLQIKSQVIFKDFADYKAVYRFSHQLDSTNTKSIHVENMLLCIGSKYTMFQSLENIERQKLLEIQRQQMDKTHSVNFVGIKSTIESEFFHEINTNKFFIKQSLLETNYFMTDEVNNINWSLSKDTKDILGYKCQKATARFRGRIYIVWFTYNIPLSVGPWKLFGLPGLIVKAEDSQKQIVFELLSFEKVNVNKLTINSPKDAIFVKKNDWQKLRMEYEADPLAYIKKSVENQGLKLNVNVNNSNIPSTKKKKISNPLELTNN